MMAMLEFSRLTTGFHNLLSAKTKQTMSISIAFIGGGNMASSLLGGLLSSSTSADKLLVCEPDQNRCQQLQQQFGIRTTQNNADALEYDVIVLAIKPQLMQDVCHKLGSAITRQSPLFISIAAGLRCEAIERWLGNSRAIVRCMPNTPSLVGKGATALYANEQTSQPQAEQATRILQAVGLTLWVNQENKLDAVTALSGSGPAYFFLLIEAMQDAAIELGLEAETACQLAQQTALGAAFMANESELDVATLRANVTSKGGTTEQAIISFEQAGFRDIVKNALQAAHERSISLADELGKGQ